MKAFLRRTLAALLVMAVFALGAWAEAPAADVPPEAAPAVHQLGGPGMEVYFLDLGRVDAILIRCDGETAFIDVGFKNDAADAARFLRALGVEQLDCYIGTHGHYDHIEGAPEIIETFHPRRVYISHVGCLSAILECASEEQKQVIAQTERLILKPGDSFPIGRGYLTCLGPISLRQCLTGSSHENENSLILRLDYGKRSLLFTGDTTDRVLREVNERYPGRLRADVMKNPHHNGAHDEDVIDLIQPKYVVYCTDDRNIPKQSYADMLAAKGIRALSTGPASNGSIVMLSDGESLEVRCGYTAQSLTLQPPPALYVGQEYPVECAVMPENLSPQRHVGWNSSDEGVVIAHNGVLKAVGPGTATVSAISINGICAAVNVTVYSACIIMDHEVLRLAVGETRRIEGRIMPPDAEGVTGEWITSDPTVATVASGKVTGVGEGTARIVARLSNGAETACEITVKGILARSVRLDRSKATLQVGDTLALGCKVAPEEYDHENLEWSSSDESILWVDQYGSVTAVGTGRAKVTVVASEGVYDTCTITVR